MNVIKDFYTRKPDFFQEYREQHSGRIKNVVDHFKLNELTNKKIGDFGCGYGFLFEYLNKENTLVGFDGAIVNKEKLITDFKFIEQDLSLESSSIEFINYFDISICLETLEHLAAPYNCILNMKKNTKFGGYIYISIPEIQVKHTVIYPGLFYPKQNFEIFLGQMALQIEEELFIPFSCHVWKCKNLPWEYKKLLFPKTEDQFKYQHPLEMVNS